MGSCRTNVVAHTGGLDMQGAAFKDAEGCTAVMKIVLDLHAEAWCCRQRAGQ